MSTMAVGIYENITESAYHKEPCPVPSLSASIAKTLWSQTPLHAWHNHARLNPDFKHDDNQKFSMGKTCHSLLLENDLSKIVVVAADSWRTNEAKAKRDAAFEDGKTPLLLEQFNESQKIVSACRLAISKSELSGILDDGKPEVTLIDEEFGMWRRSRLDWLSTDRRIIIDLKITETSVNPAKFSNFLCQMGYDMAAAFYVDINYKTGGPENAKFIWIAQEANPPYATCFIGASPSIIEIGKQKLRHSTELWRKCLAENHWPGYPNEICWAEAPSWEQDRVTQKMMANMEGDEI